MLSIKEKSVLHLPVKTYKSRPVLCLFIRPISLIPLCLYLLLPTMFLIDIEWKKDNNIFNLIDQSKPKLEPKFCITFDPKDIIKDLDSPLCIVFEVNALFLVIF